MAAYIYGMRVMRMGAFLESSGGPGWVRIANKQEWISGQARGGEKTWTFLTYDRWVPSSIDTARPEVAMHATSRIESWITPRVARMLIERIEETGALRAVVLVLRGNVVGVGPRLPQPKSGEPPVDYSLDDGDRRTPSPRAVMEKALQVGMGMGIQMDTALMRYQFWQDDDDYFWVAAYEKMIGLGPSFNLYRADEQQGLWSLVGHLIRTGADYVPARILGLSPGDRVEHERFGAAEVVSLSGDRCTMRFDVPARTMRGERMSDVTFSLDKVRLRGVRGR